MAHFGRSPYWAGGGDPPPDVPQSDEVNEAEDRDAARHDEDD